MTKNNKFQTKDYWTIIALLVAGNTPIEIEPRVFSETGRCQLTYHFAEDAKKDYEKWMLGVTDEPFGVIRKVREGVEGFKHNLHRFNTK